MDEKQFQLKMCSWAVVKIHQTWLQKTEMQISHKHNAFKRVLSKICSLAASKMHGTELCDWVKQKNAVIDDFEPSQVTGNINSLTAEYPYGFKTKHIQEKQLRAKCIKNYYHVKEIIRHGGGLVMQ